LLMKIVILLIVVGVIFGWDKVASLFKAVFQAKREFKKGLEGKEEERRERKPTIKVVK